MASAVCHCGPSTTLANNPPNTGTGENGKTCRIEHSPVPLRCYARPVLQFSLMTTAEFTIPPPYPTDRCSPLRWVFSHMLHQWPIFLVALIGAVGNAALAGVAPGLIGHAFDLGSGGSFTTAELLRIAIILTLS